MHKPPYDADPSQLEWSGRAAQGDTVALKLLLTETYARVCARVSHNVPRDLRALVEGEDVVQEAEIDVFREIGRFEPRGPDAFQSMVRDDRSDPRRDLINKPARPQARPAITTARACRDGRSDRLGLGAQKGCDR